MSGFVIRFLGFSAAVGLIYTIFVAVIGAAILTWIYRKMTAAKPDDPVRLRAL